MTDRVYLVSVSGVSDYTIQCCTNDFEKFKKYISFALLYTPVSASMSGRKIGLSVMVDGRCKYSIYLNDMLRIVEHVGGVKTKLIKKYGKLRQHHSIPKEHIHDYAGLLKYKSRYSDFDSACDCDDQSSNYNCCPADIEKRGFITAFELEELHEWIDFVNYKVEHKYLHPILVDLIDLLRGEGGNPT